MKFKFAAFVFAAVVLRAHYGSHELWQVRFHEQKAGVCKISGDGAKKSGLPLKPSPSECAKLSDLARRLSAQPGASSVNPAPMADEPDYELIYGKGRLAVGLLAPEVCDVTSSGDMKCAKQKLSAAQEMLLRLRAYARDLGISGSSR